MCSSKKIILAAKCHCTSRSGHHGPGWNMKVLDKVLVSSWLLKHVSWEARRPEGKGYFCSCIVKKAEGLGYVEDTQTIHGSWLCISPTLWMPSAHSRSPTHLRVSPGASWAIASFSFPRCFQYFRGEYCHQRGQPMSSKATSILAPALYHEVGCSAGWAESPLTITK